MKSIKKEKNSIACWSCDAHIEMDDLYFESSGGDILCEKCGDEHLFIHDFTLYDDYPYVEHEDFDGSKYQGDPYKVVALEAIE